MVFNRNGFLACLLVVAATLLPGSALAQSLNGYGVVVLHGKWGNPGQMGSVANAFQAAGARVATPTMPWAGRSGYSGGYDDAIAGIDQAVAQLKAEGATKIVIAGQSMGGNLAMGYAGRRSGVTAVVVLAPGHQPEGRTKGGAAESLAKAKQMVASGQGDATASFFDANQGQTAMVSMTARAYVSFFDPNGPANLHHAAASVRSSVPIFFVIGNADPSFPEAPALYRLAAKNKKSQYDAVEGSHMTSGATALPAIVDWLAKL